MSRIADRLRRLTGLPGVPQARHVAERSVAPYLRADLHTLATDHEATVQRLAALEIKVDQLLAMHLQSADALNQIAVHQPTILNAIASTNGTTRLLTREVGALREAVADSRDRAEAVVAHVDQATTSVRNDLGDVTKAIYAGDDAVRDEFRPHIDSIAWLLRRVETIRAEFMHELRYGTEATKEAPTVQVINPAAIDVDDLRLNIGAGHIPMEGFANVDMRELPGIDVVAPADALPFEPGTIAEIFSSHTLEHFPETQLRRTLLPYWFSLLREGGSVRAVVPDLEAMTKAYTDGTISFEILRSVAYGGQEYEGDFHFTGFTPASLAELLTECGFREPKIIARARPNGDCLEFEISATRPAA
jgi:hypothetical protein